MNLNAITKRFAQALLAAAVAVVPFQSLYAQEDDDRSRNQSKAGCVIKGNISKSGERIYHVPGQRYYDVTVISPERGERWFCSEAEARRAGWRKAKVWHR